MWNRSSWHVSPEINSEACLRNLSRQQYQHCIASSGWGNTINIIPEFLKPSSWNLVYIWHTIWSHLSGKYYKFFPSVIPTLQHLTPSRYLNSRTNLPETWYACHVIWGHLVPLIITNTGVIQILLFDFLLVHTKVFVLLLVSYTKLQWKKAGD